MKQNKIKQKKNMKEIPKLPPKKEEALECGNT